jgi:excisionase family DNA binding protein
MNERVAGGEREPIVAPDAEQAALVALDQALRRCEDGAVSLTLPDGAQIGLPATAAEMLRRTVHELARGRVLTLLTTGRELTTQQAADLLNVSRPYLIQLLDKGELAYHMVGTHRRVPLDTLLTYRHESKKRTRAALRELTQLSQELGMYDMPATATAVKTR